MEFAIYDTKKSVKARSENGENTYQHIIRLNEDRKLEIVQYLRVNGVSDQVMRNWSINRSKMTLLHYVIFGRMVNDLKLKTDE